MLSAKGYVLFRRDISTRTRFAEINDEERSGRLYGGNRRSRCSRSLPIGRACRFSRGNRSIAVDHPMVQTVERELEAIGYSQLVVHLAQVVLHDLLGCSDTGSDFLVLHALRY